MVIRKTVVFFALAIILYSDIYSQLSSPYNMGFEAGYVGGATIGWAMGFTATDSGYVAYTSDKFFTGSQSAIIVSRNKKRIETGVASFFQSIDASIYRKKRIRFSASVFAQEQFVGSATTLEERNPNLRYIDYKPPKLFISARNRRGEIITNAVSEGVYLRGWVTDFVEIIIPEEATEIRFGINFTDTNDIQIDACNLEIVSNDDNYYEKPHPLSDRELQFLIPFANIAGGIQYFHPSKAASEADWDNVLLAGVNMADDTTAVINALQNFYQQLAPQIQIANSPINTKDWAVQNKPNLLAYLHTGIPTNIRANTTTASRIVDLNSAVITTDAVVAQYIQIPKKADKVEIKLKAKIQKFHKGALANIQLRFEDEMGNFISFLKRDSIVADNWQTYTISGDIPDSCSKALIILSFRGYGRAFYDDVTAKVITGKKSQIVALRNPSFEYKLDFNNQNWLTTNETYDAGYTVGYTDKEKAAGKQSLVIAIDSTATPKLPSSEQYFYSASIGSGLHVAYPIVVPAELFVRKDKDTTGREYSMLSYATYPVSNFTVPIGKPEGFSLNWKDRASRLVECIKIYGLLKNFSLIKIDSAELNSAFIAALQASAICENIASYKQILQNFIAVSKDNRARVWYVGDDEYYHSLPFNMEYIDGKVYAANVDTSAMATLSIGDEIIGFNGENIPNMSKNEAWEIKKYLLSIKLGKQNSEVNLKFSHNGTTKEQKYYRNVPERNMLFRAVDYNQQINDSTIYIDLTAYSDKEIDAAYDILATNHNFIFDLRGDAMVGEYFLSLLYDKFYQSSQVCVPYFAAPDKQLMSYYPAFMYYQSAEKKHFRGKFVFLTDWRTYGYGELLASVIKDYKMGTIVGSKTQGTLVEGVPIRLDAEFSISLGTMFGSSPMGRQFPIEPDIEVQPSKEQLDGDLILQRAVEFLLK